MNNSLQRSIALTLRHYIDPPVYDDTTRELIETGLWAVAATLYERQDPPPIFTGGDLPVQHLTLCQAAAQPTAYFCVNNKLSEAEFEVTYPHLGSPAWVLAKRRDGDVYHVIIKGISSDTDADISVQEPVAYGQHHIHSGYLHAAYDILDKIKQLLPGNNTYLVSGYSLGGGVAACLVWLMMRHTDWPVYGVAFGSAPCMDETLSQSRVMQKHFLSVCHQYDLFPWLSARAQISFIQASYQRQTLQLQKWVSDLLEKWPRLTHSMRQNASCRLHNWQTRLGNLHTAEQILHRSPVMQVMPAGRICQLSTSRAHRVGLNMFALADVAPAPSVHTKSWLVPLVPGATKWQHAHSMELYNHLLQHANRNL